MRHLQSLQSEVTIMDILQILPQFISGVKQQHGQDFNPHQTVQNMLGVNCNTPQETLELMLKSGKLNQQQYNTAINMLSKF